MVGAFSLSSFIAGAALGVFLAGGWLTLDTYRFFSNTPSTEQSKPTQMLKSGAVEVSQQAAGDSVRIETVTVSPPGVWIAIRETVGNELGNVLGAARVSGPQSEVIVPLLRGTLPRRTYAVELYRDDNAGVFDPGVNSVYVDFDTGARVVERFQTEE